jgi:glycosyl hydrolase family 10
MKYWVLRPDEATVDFRQGDEIVRFAQAHGMKVRGRCLVWGRSNPDWLTEGYFTNSDNSRDCGMNTLIAWCVTRRERFSPGTWSMELLMRMECAGVQSGYKKPGIGFSRHGTKYIEHSNPSGRLPRAEFVMRHRRANVDTSNRINAETILS